MGWVLSILTWILSNFPLADILLCVMKWLRIEASKTDSNIDDKAVDFLEFVLNELGWISTPVTDAQVSASKKAK